MRKRTRKPKAPKPIKLNYATVLRMRHVDDFCMPAPVDYMAERNKQFLTEWHIRKGRKIEADAETAEFIVWARKARRGWRGFVDDIRVIMGSLL